MSAIENSNGQGSQDDGSIHGGIKKEKKSEISIDMFNSGNASHYRRSRVLRRLVHNLQGLGAGLEPRAYKRNIGWNERTLPDPVVVKVTIDCPGVIGEVDVGAGNKHRDEGKEEEVYR